MGQRERVKQMMDSIRRNDSQPPVHARGGFREHMEPLHFPDNIRMTRLIADGTGRSQEEIPLLVASMVVSALLAGAWTASVGVLRLVDFVLDA